MGDRVDNGEFQLIDGDGRFNVDGLGNFLKKVNFDKCGLDYVLLSIIGPQSSGKSTLLNNLFNTSFKMMDASGGRSQTTNGIWLASCGRNEHRSLIIMDVEGSDGKERGPDDTAFEKQTALFSLVLSDIVLINMWYHDIGREQAANKPLLRIVFEEILKLSDSRKVSLIFVIRDKSAKTPLEMLEKSLKKDMDEIWHSLPKPEHHKDVSLGHFFNVQVVGFSSYDSEEDKFKKEVASFGQRFVNPTASGGVVGNRGDVVPASAFSVSAQGIWKSILENKNLDIPAHKTMVATLRCDEIANQKFELFSENETWKCLERDVQTGTITSFGNQIDALINDCLARYDEEARLFEERVRDAKQKLLLEKILQAVKPSWDSVMEHIRSKTLETLKKEFVQALENGKTFSDASAIGKESLQKQFDQGCADATIHRANWDTSKLHAKIQNDYLDYLAYMSEQAAIKHEAQLSELRAQQDREARERAAKEHEDELSRLREQQTKEAQDRDAREQAAIIHEAQLSELRAQHEKDARERAAKEHEDKLSKLREQHAKDTQDRDAREQAAREQSAREQAAREQAAREKAAREQADIKHEAQLSELRAQHEKDARERAAKEHEDKLSMLREQHTKDTQDRDAREQAARERAAREQAAPVPFIADLASLIFTGRYFPRN